MNTSTEKRLVIREVYDVVVGAFKGQSGIVTGQFMDGLYWLQTGKDSKILVTCNQVELMK